MTKTNKIIISAIVIAILFGGYVYFDRKSRNEQNNLTNTATSTNTSQTIITTNSGTQITTQGTGGYTITEVPITEGRGVPQPIPDLNRPITVSVGVPVSADVIVMATGKILPLQAQLKKNPNDLSAWIGLGIYQKMAGDYQGAVISWQYASRLNTKDYVSLGDLGDLYANFLKDYPRAEMYYKQAIVNGPTQENLYVQFAQVYLYQFNDKTKALAIVGQGLLKLPNDVNLLKMQADLSK